MCSFWVFIFPAHFFPIILPRLFFRAKSTTLRGREGGSDARSTPRFGTVAFCVLLLGTEKAFDDIEETPARTHTSEEEPRAEKILNHQDEKRRVVVCLYFLYQIWLVTPSVTNFTVSSEGGAFSPPPCPAAACAG